MNGVALGTLMSDSLSVFNHSCCPTAYLAVELRPGKAPKCAIRATADLSPGDEVTLSYAPMACKPSALRKQQLRDAYFFECDCRLCAAPEGLDALVRCGRR